MKFDRVHRVGADTAKKPRPIVAKFHYFKERELVRQKGYEASETLKKDNYGIGIQWPKQVRDARKELYPVMKRLKDNGHQNVKMVRDKLYVNGREYNGPRAPPQSMTVFPYQRTTAIPAAPCTHGYHELWRTPQQPSWQHLGRSREAPLSYIMERFWTEKEIM